MTRKLNSLDRQAIDLVMDRFTASRDSGVVAMTDAPPEVHVKAVERILGVLAQMPPVDPPTDLATRTMRRIDQGVTPSTEPRQIPPYLGPGQLPA